MSAVEKLVHDNLDIPRAEARRWSHTHVEQEDLVAEGAAALVGAAKSFDGRGAFQPYARQRVRWAITDVIRSRARKARLDDGYASVCGFTDVFVDDDEPGHEWEPADPGPSVEEQVIARERLRALMGIPERERHVLVRQALGDTLDEIAGDMGVSVSRVSSLAATGAARLGAVA